VPRIRPVRGEEGGSVDDRAATAAYVAALTAELAVIAGRHDLHRLKFLLEMARLEAEASSQGV
jgi:hypothetical protein